jgi:hypothetical protein
MSLFCKRDACNSDGVHVLSRWWLDTLDEANGLTGTAWAYLMGLRAINSSPWGIPERGFTTPAPFRDIRRARKNVWAEGGACEA